MKKYFTYSKALPIITGIIFIGCLMFGFKLTTLNVYDVSVYVSSIGCSGAIFGTVLVNYLKKASAENAYKLRMSLYENTVKQNLYYNEEMMKLKKKYEMTDADVCEINDEGNIDEMKSDALMSTISSLDNSSAEADVVQELQSFSI